MSDLGNKEIFSKNLKFYMNLYNKTRNEISKALGVSYTTFASWENGTNYPRIDKIEMLANYFKVSKADLIENKYKKQSGYYEDAEASQYAEMIRNKPGARALFSASKDLTKEQMEDAVNYIEFLKSRNKG
ncbi:helix-turn-helix domain-containing protein [Veillonella intestinalis]|uniref:helix-turn-helix domain-containing protein n=1 Tax=Veillonella intestinalis TaxID=2941341 RepID=UPI00203B9CE0|nr:helix-turn-helix transcriptional regulator [Veillonella intestinalis]